MNRFEQLVTDVWQEVGRHIELPDALAAITGILARAAPLQVIEILHIDSERRELETVAVIRRDDRPPLHGRRIGLTRAHFDSLQDWARRERVIALPTGSEWPAMLMPFEDLYDSHDALFGVLRDRMDRPAGFVVLLLAPGSFEQGLLDLIAQLLEPLTVALENDGRLRELNQLRATAEADKQSLLHRLGREQLSEEIIGTGNGLRPVLTRVDQVARSDSSILLLGETGSGKEVIARAIHERSLRAQMPFIRVNCGAMPPELIDSELFGHEKGSFTGAIGQRKGWFEQADGGTLFLDEIGELPLTAQVRLLRVLQDGTLNRVGGEQVIQVDVRVIAATHRDLAAMAQDGTFREDLWYRIAVFPILIPPLRDRLEDIPELARHFARKAAIRLGLQLQLPTAADITLLQGYPWPGNVREMSSVIERAAILGEGKRLEIAAALGLSTTQRPTTPARSERKFTTLDQAIEQHICAALTRTHGRVDGPQGAARLLNLNPHTLRSKMRRFGIDPRPFRDS